MRIPFFQQRARDYALEPLAAADSDAVAILHQEDFIRPWSGEEFADLLEQDTVFGFVAREVGRRGEAPVGFVLARLAASEGEILTLAVARSHRRRGIGWLLMDAVLRRLHSDRAQSLFLEVDETNAAAIALYRRLGFHEVGQRPAYYSGSAGRTGALVMRRDLG